MFEILKQDPDSRGRLGHLKTEHGIIETPAYVIVGTHGEVRCLESVDLVNTKTQLIISNTYHLWRTLGEEGLNDFPGLHEYMRWNGPIMTDSGGFQVFSLGFLREYGMRRGEEAVKEFGNAKAVSGQNLVRITPSGVYFKPYGEESEEVYLDAETSIRIQEQLGADIVVAFDEPTSPLHGLEYTRQAMDRTHAWAHRSLDAKQSDQKIYGVVQGGAFEELRSASAKHIGNLPFDGFAIGSTYGDAYGGTKNMTRQMLDWSIPYLPENKARHLFGVGSILDIFNGVEAGIDTFDCVIPTREARHGRIWTSRGHIDIKKGRFALDDDPLDPFCQCPVCSDKKIMKRDLHSAFKEKNPEAGHFATIHNVFFFNDFMEKIRVSLREGRFSDFREEFLGGMENSGLPNDDISATKIEN
jgi:tRNA-guanine family transglycosylase